MKFSGVLKLAAAALATGALLAPSVAPAQAAYPPSVSLVYASPYLSGGYASVSVVGQHLTSLVRVKATYGATSTYAGMSAHSGGTTAVGSSKVSAILPTTANRYTVKFLVYGGGVTGDLTTTQAYIVGKQTTIKSFRASKTSYGLYISGTTAKSAPVKIWVKFGSRTYYKTVKASSGTGFFSYKFYKTSKGTYYVSADIAPNTKYFSNTVTTTYRRS